MSEPRKRSRAARLALAIALPSLASGCSLFLGDGDGEVDGEDVFGLPAQSQLESTTNAVLVDLVDGDGLLVAVVTQQPTPSSATDVTAGAVEAIELGAKIASAHSVQLFFAAPEPGEVAVTASFVEPIHSIVTAIPVQLPGGAPAFTTVSGDGLAAPANITVPAGPGAPALCTFAGVSDREPALASGALLWSSTFAGMLGDARGRNLAAGAVGPTEVSVEFISAWVGLCTTPASSSAR